MTECTVVIPIGPAPHHQEHLAEAISSMRAQTVPVRILLIDDMAELSAYGSWAPRDLFGIDIWRAPWRLGVPAAFNVGVAVAATECVFLMGSDDTLQPDCIEQCLRVYDSLHQDRQSCAYLYVGVHYMGGEYSDQFVPCNAAMVTKSLWKRCGGFAPESAVGACDAALISTMMVHPDAGSLYCVNSTVPLYNYRVTQTSDTAAHGEAWQGPVLEVRNLLTRDWKPPAWGRYE
jgi:glycosyltransferase involved in cell wall biosynthesis